MPNFISTIDLLLSRLRENRYSSYDHYDFWGSRKGIELRKNKSLFTLPAVGLAYLIDVIFPMKVRKDIKPARAMETLPYIMHAMLVYRRLAGDDKYEEDRKELFGYMLERLGESKHGKGVGHQFDWYTTTLIPAYTPCVTLTSYLVDYILETGAEGGAREEKLLRDIGEFVFRDLNMVDNGDGTCKVTYTELDNRHVVNANSYAARIMYRLGKLFGREDYLSMAKGLHSWVLNMQNDDGGWFYFEKGSVPENENFIDCFHTAFVLENLIEWVEKEKDKKADVALEAGMANFVRTFITSDATIKHFAKSHLPIKITADARSTAEAFNLLALIFPLYPEHLRASIRVYYRAKEELYNEEGNYFYFRKYPFYVSKMNYIRWAAAPMLNAITNLAVASEEERKKSDSVRNIRLP